jgi:hypothetical protein
MGTREFLTFLLMRYKGWSVINALEDYYALHG